MRFTPTCTLALLLAFLAGACGTPRDPLPDQVFGPPTLASDFDEVRPVQVIVEKVEAAGIPDAPLDAVRKAFYLALIERLYAPLKLDVDPALIPEDPRLGRLIVRLTGWDRSRIGPNGTILATGEALLSVGENTVWQTTFTDLRLRCCVPERKLTTKQADARAASVLGARVMRELPIKGD
jgi:hypothetical protein